MRISGRCYCGMSDAWMARNPDEHMECWSLRWCGVCGEVAMFGEACEACRYRPTPKKRADCRAWWAEQRAKRTKHYEQDKARKRERYATDPAYAAKQKRTPRFFLDGAQNEA